MSATELPTMLQRRSMLPGHRRTTTTPPGRYQDQATRLPGHRCHQATSDQQTPPCVRHQVTLRHQTTPPGHQATRSPAINQDHATRPPAGHQDDEEEEKEEDHATTEATRRTRTSTSTSTRATELDVRTSTTPPRTRHQRGHPNAPQDATRSRDQVATRPPISTPPGHQATRPPFISTLRSPPDPGHQATRPPVDLSCYQSRSLSVRDQGYASATSIDVDATRPPGHPATRPPSCCQDATRTLSGQDNSCYPERSRIDATMRPRATRPPVRRAPTTPPATRTSGCRYRTLPGPTLPTRTTNATSTLRAPAR